MRRGHDDEGPVPGVGGCVEEGREVLTERGGVLAGADSGRGGHDLLPKPEPRQMSGDNVREPAFSWWWERRDACEAFVEAFDACQAGGWSVAVRALGGRERRSGRRAGVSPAVELSGRSVASGSIGVNRLDV
jgi:hypothetical protein